MFSEARYDKNNILWSVGFVIGQSNTDYSCSCNDFNKGARVQTTWTELWAILTPPPYVDTFTK